MNEYIVEFGGQVNLENKYIHERVVRCRDCKYGEEVVWPKSWDVPDDYRDCTGPLVTTWNYYNDEPKSNPVSPDGFCAWGERRDA